ncbi:ApeA N-terminal domain 1-containing protein [Methylobacterium oryzae CBMB20]
MMKSLAARKEKSMWVCIPDEEGKEAWTGTITRGENSKARWEFELIRHINGFEDLYSTTPFKAQQPVVALLDYQTRCTIVRPLITSIDPGSLGVLINFLRTRIEGSCDALLRGLAISDPSEAIFLGLRFTSEAFTSWYAPPAHKHTYDHETRTPEVEIKSDKTDKFTIPGFGLVECTTGARLSNEGVHSTYIKSASLFRLSFEQPKSLDETRRICFGLERLFGFLIGHRGALPQFTIWTNAQYKVGERDLYHDGILEIGGVDYVEKKPPHPMSCVHLSGLGSASLETICGNFLANQSDLITRMHAVEFCRFFSSNLNDKFSVIMPVLEEFLKGRYASAEEVSYIQYREKFFAYVDASGDEDIQEFSRKHLNVKDDKSPSLAKLIERAINYLNEKGFVIPPKFAKGIQQRRGKMFHSTPDMTDADVGAFSLEISAAVAIVLFHIFDDLGIDPALLAERYSALSDMAFLMKKPSPPARDPNAPVMSLAEAMKQVNDGAKQISDDATSGEPKGSG